jgi:hypothetical protein
MKKYLVGWLFVALVTPLLQALPPGVSSIPFVIPRTDFTGGDSITIQEVLATSPNFGVGTTFVVRGTYTLQSHDSAIMGISLTTTESILVPSQATARKQVAAGTGTFEMEYTIQFAGSVYIAFTPTTGGNSFGRIYFSGTQTSGGGSNTPSGLSSVPFATSRAQFQAGDSITIQEVLASSPRLEPGDTVVVRGTYALQSRDKALLMLLLTANAPGATEQIAAKSRKEIAAGSGAFELEYTIQQPGSLHISFYPVTSGSSFGGVYFAPPGAAGNTTPALTSPTANTGLLGNLSIRSMVSPGSGALIAGITVTDRERYVLIRGVGPSLSKFGVTGVLAKPQLSVYNASNELVASTGAWSTSFNAMQRAGIELLTSSVGAFPLTAGSDDAVLHLRLVPGSYTIVVGSADGQSGVALIEVYASSTFTLP